MKTTTRARKVEAMIAESTVEWTTPVRTQCDKRLLPDAFCDSLTFIYQQFCYREGVRAETILL